MKNKKSLFVILLSCFLLVNIINSFKSSYFKIESIQSLDTNYSYLYDLYKCQEFDVYIRYNNEENQKQLISRYKYEPELNVNHFNIFDLSALFLKQRDTLSLTIDQQENSICISFKNKDKFGLCQSNVFNVDFDDYIFDNEIKYNNNEISILKGESKSNNGDIEVFIELK